MAFDTLWPELTFHTSVSCAHLSGNMYKYLRNSQYKSLNLRTHYGAINALRHRPFWPARQETQVPSLAEHVEGEETSEVDEQARSHQAAWHFTEEAHLASDKFAWYWTSLLTTGFVRPPWMLIDCESGKTAEKLLRELPGKRLPRGLQHAVVMIGGNWRNRRFALVVFVCQQRQDWIIIILVLCKRLSLELRKSWLFSLFCL